MDFVDDLCQSSSLVCKVYIFWEGHKTLQNLQSRFVISMWVKSTVGILQNFEAFSEYMNFNFNF